MNFKILKAKLFLILEVYTKLIFIFIYESKKEFHFLHSVLLEIFQCRLQVFLNFALIWFCVEKYEREVGEERPFYKSLCIHFFGTPFSTEH